MGEREPAAGSNADSDDAYRTVFGAFPYAALRSRSYLFTVYVLVGGLLALFATMVFLFAFVGLLGSLSGTPSGLLTFQPALYLLVWLFAVGPTIAPILLVARRHRHGTDDRRYDAVLAATGYVFVASLYLAAVISTPATQQETVQPGLFASAVRFLYDLPQLAGLAPPVVAAALVVAAHYRLR